MVMDGSHWEAIASPWGETSDQFRIGTIHGIEVFLPRHGRGHPHPAERDQLPGQYRCDEAGRSHRSRVDLGLRLVPRASAAGHLRHRRSVHRPDLCARRASSEPAAWRMSLADPISPRLADRVEAAARKAGISCHRGGTYLPWKDRNSPPSPESRLYRQWGCDVIGMTNMPGSSPARRSSIPPRWRWSPTSMAPRPGRSTSSRSSM